MSRARNLKPGFFKNEKLADLPFQYRILFQGLWCIADREGRLEARPKRIKAEVFPYDKVDVEAGLDALQSAGFIERYAVEEVQYIQVLAFKKHQNPHCKEAASTIPAPCEHSASTEISGTSPADSLNPITDSLNPIDGDAPSTRGKPRKRPIPADFGISERVTRWAAEKGYTRLPERLERFVSVSKAKGYQYIDWDEAFMNAIRDDWAKFGHASPATRRPEVTLG
jgi:hypothetical protein